MCLKQLSRSLAWLPLVLLLSGGLVVAVISFAKRTPEKASTDVPSVPPASGKAPKPKVADVSLIQLIANPEKYDGQFVRVIGYVRLEFEGNAIYLHKEDRLQGIARNALWLDVTGQLMAESRAGTSPLSDKYCIVEGTFNAQEHGHWGRYPGTIKDIKRFKKW